VVSCKKEKEKMKIKLKETKKKKRKRKRRRRKEKKSLQIWYPVNDYVIDRCANRLWITSVIKWRRIGFVFYYEVVGNLI
jgi:hypothetical protein